MAIQRIKSSTDMFANPEANLVSTLMHMRTEFHTRHLQSQSHSEHVVLDEVYTLCGKAVDVIAEQALGAGLNVFPEADRSTSVDPCSNLLSYIDKLSALCELVQDPTLKNTVEEQIGEFKQTLYKLRMHG